MRYRITTPVLGHTEVIGGCAFTNGVYEGAAAGGPLSHFAQNGYGIEELDDVAIEAAEPDSPHDPLPPLPSKSASKGDWKAAAIARGMSEEDAEKTTRDDLAAHYTKEADQ